MPTEATTPEPVQQQPAVAPPQISPWLRVVNIVWVWPAFAVATIVCGTIALTCALWDTSGRQQHFIARQWARLCLRIAFSPARMEHAERLLQVPAVYACNHLSYYDTPVIFGRLPFQFRILAKAPLWKIPFIGWWLNRSGQVPIDQSSARAGIASLGRAVTTLQQNHLPIVIFPEGGRTATGTLQPMAAGAAWIAIKAQVPLVPMTLVGTYELLPIHVYAMRPRPLKLIIGEPIDTTGMTTRDAEALTARLFQIIHDTYVANSPDA